MNLALQEAWKYQGLTYPNPAVGAVLVDQNGKILSVEAHKKAGFPHAEVEALKAGFLQLCRDKELTDTLLPLSDSKAIHDFLTTHHDNVFKGCSLYVTLEPCSHFGKTPPCSLLISNLKLKKVIIGSLDPNPEAAGGKRQLEENGIEVVSGIKGKSAKELLEPFMRWQAERFVFFKHAQTLNGTIDGGYISGEQALRRVHELRDRIDLLVIGGNTVRTDRPTLDARLVGGKAPDVLIYSREKEFDRTIPLLNIEGREVIISDSLEQINKYNYVMIEGGGSMYEAAREYIDWHLTLLSPSLRSGLNFCADMSEELLYSEKIGDDLLLWSRMAR